MAEQQKLGAMRTFEMSPYVKLESDTGGFQLSRLSPEGLGIQQFVTSFGSSNQ